MPCCPMLDALTVFVAFCQKSVVSEKSAAKLTKGEGDVEKASKSSSKRKRSGQKKVCSY